MPLKRKKKIELPPETPDLASSFLPQQTASTSGGLKMIVGKYKILIFAFLLVGLIGLFLTNKGLLIAAVVDGRPIFRWDLNRVLASRYGQQTLENMINEALIANAAKKAGVNISQKNIDAKEEEIVKSLGGNVKLDDLLKYQGMTKSDFDDQIRLQLTVQQILGKDIAISDADIAGFIATNAATLTATDPAKLKEEARQAIMDKLVGEKLQPWFLELKQKANVIKFL